MKKWRSETIAKTGCNRKAIRLGLFISEKMKRLLLLFSLLLLCLLRSHCQNNDRNITQVSADSMINNVEKYFEKEIETEGIIVHVCGVDGKKMKLKTDKGEIIKIATIDSTLRFDKSYKGKTVIIQGSITESKIENNLIDSLAKDKVLLCHIDNTPCKDKEWVDYQINKGNAESISKKDIERLRAKMLQTGKDYVSVFTIIAKKIIIKEEEKPAQSLIK